ncbi:hypothetical protein ACXIVC_21885 [Vibrio parahaemolyticus]|nr:hypothetical protein [Vibrio alginolyticus]
MKTKEVPLLDGRKVVVSEITYGVYKETRESSDEFDNDFALVLACSSLTLEELEELDTPDFNELLIAATSLNDPETIPTVGQDTVPLSQPALTLMGEKVETVNISMPKVKHSRELSKLKQGFSRIEYMIKSTTGLADLDSMPMSDYSVLVIAVPDFFVKGAAFFQKHKLNKSLPSSM